MYIRKAFTLIELVVVMVIISSLLMLTMNFSFRSVDGIRARYESQQIQDELYKVVSLTQQSDLIQGQAYTDITLNLDQKTLTTQASGKTISTLALKETTLKFVNGPLNIMLKPYILGCTVSQGDPKHIEVEYKKSTLVCFHLDLGTCKFIVHACSTP